MNEPSSANALDLVNRVLLNCGEQPARTISETVAAKRAFDALKTARNEILLLGHWSFLRTVADPDSWEDFSKTFYTSRFTQIEDVWYDGKVLQNVSWQDGADQSVEDDVPPTQWMLINQRQIRLNVYPTETVDRAKVKVVGYRVPIQMTADGSGVEMPEMFVDALVYRTMGAFSLTHLNDSALANQYNNAYEVRLQTIRDLDRGAPRRVGNMFNKSVR